MAQCILGLPRGYQGWAEAQTGPHADSQNEAWSTRPPGHQCPQGQEPALAQSPSQVATQGVAIERKVKETQTDDSTATHFGQRAALAPPAARPAGEWTSQQYGSILGNMVTFPKLKKV